MHALSIPLYFSRFMVDIYIVGGGTLLGFFIAYFESGLSTPSYIARIGDVFMVMGTILFGFCAGLAVVGQFIYNPGVDEYTDEDTDEDVSKDIIETDAEYEYINRYYDEFYEMSNEALTSVQLLELHNNFLEETTPRGDVIMSYNIDAETFWYWMDNKNITYEMLNAVARKFTTEYKCISLYKCNVPVVTCDNNIKDLDISNNADLENTTETDLRNTCSIDTDNPDEVEESKHERKSVFAKFKQYNKNINVKVTTPQRNNGVNNQHQNTEKTNRFTYKGKLNEHIISHTKNTDETTNVKAIDFATFKRMMQLENINISKVETS